MAQIDEHATLWCDGTHMVGVGNCRTDCAIAEEPVVDAGDGIGAADMTFLEVLERDSFGYEFGVSRSERGDENGTRHGQDEDDEGCG